MLTIEYSQNKKSITVGESGKTLYSFSEACILENDKTIYVCSADTVRTTLMRVCADRCAIIYIDDAEKHIDAEKGE